MYVQQSGGPNSSNRSVSMSMDDSATLHLHQVNQKMKIVNEQQLHVRKPSEKEIQKCDHCSAIQSKSPANTSLTPQIPSDRVNVFPGSEIKDLLLINEEPSVKEQSLQIGNGILPNKILSMEDLEQGQEQSVLKQNIVIDEKIRNSFSEVRWSKMISSKSNPTTARYKLHQFSIISDQGAQFIMKNVNKLHSFLKRLISPQKYNNLIQLLYRILVGLFQIYYLSFILLELQQQQPNIIKNPFCQFLMFFTQIYEIFLKFTSIQYQNGVEINKITQNFKIYFQFRIYLDLITFMPFIFYLSNSNQYWIHILYLIRLLDIRESLILLSQLINSINFAFFAQIILELHFLINLCGAIINQLTGQNQSIQQIGIYSIFQINQDVEIYIQYLVYVIQLLFICYLLFLVKQILKYDYKDQIDLKQLTIDQNQKLQLMQQIQSLEAQSDNISVTQYLEVLPTKVQEEIKFAQYSKYLKSLQILKNSFSESTFQQLTTLMQEFSLPPNSQIISPQSRNQSLYFILSGNIQIYQNNSEKMFRLHIVGQNQAFNNQAFFMNQLPNIGAITIGYCRILQLDYDLFQDLLQKIHAEKQKYKMIVDQVCLYQHYYLAGIKCYACHQHHDINNCSNVHYIPNSMMLIQYIHENEQMQRINFIRKKTKSEKLNKATIFKIEDAALLFQQFNVESELSNYERQIYRSEYQPSINKQLTTPFSSPNHDNNDDKQVSNQGIPAEEERQQALELNNISPVPHIQQPPSGFSHSSYQYLLKDVSITYNHKKPKVEGSDKDKNSSNMFSVPYSSSGTSKNNLKNSKNSEILAQYKQQEQQEKEEQISIQIKKSNAQDSLFYNQRRLFKHRNSGSQNENQSNSSSKYKKYYTGIQQSQKSERSERKSNSMINDYISERGLLQQYLEQKNNEDNRQQSRNGIQSSKFTGETAKQFMHNPLEMPNIDFYQSFEKSNQFSDYFPDQNIDQAIESYKQYQASRSSLYNQQK